MPMENIAQPTITNDVSRYNETISDSLSYLEYRELVSKHVSEGTSSGPEQTEALAQYTLLNDSRLRRLDKTTIVPSEIKRAFENFNGNQTWLVLTESWCGDAAQSMPMMNALTELSPNIAFRVALRDDNLALMNLFLTNDAMSIPKLIVLNNETEKISNAWGPRPSIAAAMVEDFKKEHGALTPEFKRDLQVWYNKDKGKTIAADLATLIG
ncbi:MAG: hypothetical protein ACI86C_000059 [Candidatus Latescibacterota bacterium]|jgi:hypothetical protein